MADDKKYTTIHYHNYLELDKILSAQTTRSGAIDGKPAHEETLFIIVHQVYELWFKQIIHELSSIIDPFAADSIDEQNIGIAIGRLERVIEIQKLLVQQITVLETMTPLDFLDFRNYLFPASGFQSFQFRKIEVMLGLLEDERITYGNHHYSSPFNEEQKTELKELSKGRTVFETIESWLERIPFLKFKNFDFLSHYKSAVNNMITKEQEAIKASSFLTDKEIESRLKMLGDTDTYFDSILDPKVHAEKLKKGELRLSYNATLAALLINLYRDEPILHNPFRLLISLVEIDELMVTWRYRHAQMVLRMLGRKIGTGGSSGHDYLNKTAEKHRIFTDFHNISTLLIPRSELPTLPDDLKKELSFNFSNK